jgi:uncharacterized protein YjiS (DUF1127 family)
MEPTMSTLRFTVPLASHLRLVGASVARLPARAFALTSLARSRRSLGRLDDHLLQDIGLTRAEAMAEAERAIWNAPRHWKG